MVESACSAGDPGSFLRLGRSPEKGNGNPLQYSCLENPMDRGAWQATVHGVVKSRIWLSNLTELTNCYVCLIWIGASLIPQTIKNTPVMQETWVWSLGWEDPLEKGMAAHSSILAWRIPWTEEPGGLQSMRSPRVRHDWATKYESRGSVWKMVAVIMIYKH